jgi:U3 small nucleolar RNA-associated protein 3
VPIRDWRSEVQKVNERKSRILAKAAEAEHKREEEMEKGGQIVGEAYEKNDYYEAVKAAKEKKKEAKKEAKKPKLMDYVPEPTVQDGEKRTASNMIVKNRGLVPHRSKEKKNPRVKHRKKFEKAKVKERTSFYGKQTRDDRGGYGGETTGIKAHISRSRKF